MYSIDNNPDSLRKFGKMVEEFKGIIESEIRALIKSYYVFENETQRMDLSNIKWQVDELSKIINEGSFSLVDLKCKIDKYIDAIERIRSIVNKNCTNSR